MPDHAPRLSMAPSGAAPVRRRHERTSNAASAHSGEPIPCFARHPKIPRPNEHKFFGLQWE